MFIYTYIYMHTYEKCTHMDIYHIMYVELCWFVPIIYPPGLHLERPVSEWRAGVDPPATEFNYDFRTLNMRRPQVDS